jgi:hypothetical protein
MKSPGDAQGFFIFGGLLDSIWTQIWGSMAAKKKYPEP